MNPLIVPAYAKINLHLHITGRRDDGYHMLDSLVAFADLHDTLHLHFSSAPYQLNTSPALDCATENNLVTRATHLIAHHFNLEPHLRIDLEKNIPTGAGLGGGSADAAATLLALRDFWKLDAPDTLLQKFASELGSDIVACLQGKPVVMRDTGNLLHAAPDFPTLYGILVNPQTPCPTQTVYKNYAASKQKFSSDVAFPNHFETIQSFCDFLNHHTQNDLTDAAIFINPHIRGVLDALTNLSDALLVRMSGSGSTCFALFETEDTTLRNSQILETLYPEWWVKPVVIKG